MVSIPLKGAHAFGSAARHGPESAQSSIVQRVGGSSRGYVRSGLASLRPPAQTAFPCPVDGLARQRAAASGGDVWAALPRSEGHICLPRYGPPGAILCTLTERTTRSSFLFPAPLMARSHPHALLKLASLIRIVTVSHPDPASIHCQGVNR